jgi:hypothetical protein
MVETSQQTSEVFCSVLLLPPPVRCCTRFYGTVTLNRCTKLYMFGVHVYFSSL